ncbi:hypothetical protein ACYTFC_23810 [Streptomyces globosus]|uniref:hypothetical protein n=1 Tax=Streptomyces sp. WAC05292 TaxID=2487418 RepID=UPI000F7475A1|nr:hypothetical protein [Streptomyces sp. WAC05292]RSS95529.1 hypothetical protein EF903_04710 [Streptomyces sp. WAC05292]
MPHRTAAPEPAHRSSRPVHWLATACALAAAVAAAGLLQPAAAGPATGAEARTAPGGAAAPQAAAPDAAAAAYPLDCKGAPVAVTATAQGDLDGDGRPETVAAVRCDAGSGTPPHALYVLTAGREPGAAPRIVATLLEAAARNSADDLTVRDGVVTARLLGYSSPEVPRSSPDVHRLAKWRWTGGKFRQELTNISTGSV